MGETWMGRARPGSRRPKGRVDPRPREIREAMLLGAATPILVVIRSTLKGT